MIENKIFGSNWRSIFFAFLLFLLCLLLGNIMCLSVALNLNKYICSEAVQAATSVCQAGGNLLEVKLAAIRAVNDPVINIFFIKRPELKELRFYVKNQAGQRQQMLLVKTSTGVRVPAPFLLVIASPQPNGFLFFETSCEIKLKDLYTSGLFFKEIF